MLASHLPPSFFDTCTLSTSSLGCNVLCMFISFLVPWSIYLRSSLIHFKNSPKYLIRGTVQAFIPFIRFLFSSCFLVLLRYSLLIFSFIFTYLMGSAYNIPKYLSSSSSCRGIGTDIPDPLSLPLPVIHRFRQVLRATPRILTELLYVGAS